VKPLHILFWLAVSSPLLALIPKSPDPWTVEVERACTAQRYGLRLAAARKVAGGGGAAVPAIRAWAEQRDKNQLPTSLVEAIAEHDGIDDAVIELLLAWATDRDFYWRAQAMKGLASRGPSLPARRDPLEKLFAAHHDDAAWLTRVYARLGTALLGAGETAALPEADPRAATKLCALLLQHGKTPGLQPLFDALLDERTFQDVPWGQHRATEAAKALKAWLGEDHPLPDGQAFADKAAAVEALLTAARKKSGQQLARPAPAVDASVPFDGAIELLSCRSGDLFLQWTADGVLYAGIDGKPAGRLPAQVWEELSRERTALQLDTNHGAVICDSMRLRWKQPDVHSRIAPASLPEAAAKWLAHLAKALQEADQPRLAEALRAGLEQFGTH